MKTTRWLPLGASFALLGAAVLSSAAAPVQAAEPLPLSAGDAGPILVPAGTFTMGSEAGAADERPVHRVFNSAFAIDRREVTNGRFAACVRAGACKPPALKSSQTRPEYFGDPKYADFPVIFVDAYQAAAFCKFAGGRLPTEAEWEHAARGTDDARTYPWGDAKADCAHANMSGMAPCVGDTDRVGARPAGQSPYGVDDMAGNVWEWTADHYDPGYYSKTQRENPKGPERGELRVMRGGCWQSGADSLRVSCRKAELPSTWAPNVGFRCVYDAKKAVKGAK